MKAYGISDNERTPFLSVIIPVYNVGPYISGTLGSLEKQTSRDFEVIIVNDGSTDDSMEYVSEFLSQTELPSVKVLDQQNGGVSRARNRGIEEARGEYLLFLDADDLIHETLVERTCHASAVHSPDMLYFGFDRVRSNGRISQLYTRRGHYIEGLNNGQVILESKLKGKCQIWTSSFICKRDFILEQGLRFTPGCSHGEDQEFILKCLFHAETVDCIPESLSFYVRRDDSATRRFSLNIFSSIGAHRRVYLYFTRRGADPHISSILSRYLIPKQYVENIFLLLKSNCSRETVLKISRHLRIREAIRPLRIPTLSKRDIYLWIDSALLLYCPELVVNLCFWGNRAKRFFRGRSC